MKPPALISKRLACAGSLLSIALGGAVANAQELRPPTVLHRIVRGIEERARDAVVKVHARREFPLGGESGSTAYRVGTGFFVDPQGVLLTTDTVVRGADRCWVEWRDQRWPARLLGQCPRVNLAVLQVASPTPALAWGDARALRVDSLVVAMGFPYEQMAVAVMGRVHGWEIRRGSHVFATSHLRTSCGLRPGQGGGPVLNGDGEVIGVAVAAHGDRETYVLPAPAVQRVLGEIRQHGEPRLGWVGLDVTERSWLPSPTVTPEVEVVVRDILPSSPAAAAGFLPADRLMTVQGRPVESLAVLLDEMFLCRQGEQVAFEVLRDNRPETVWLTVGARPSQPEPSEPRLSTPLLAQPPDVAPEATLPWEPVGYTR